MVLIFFFLPSNLIWTTVASIWWKTSCGRVWFQSLVPLSRIYVGQAEHKHPQNLTRTHAPSFALSTELWPILPVLYTSKQPLMAIFRDRKRRTRELHLLKVTQSLFLFFRVFLQERVCFCFSLLSLICGSFRHGKGPKLKGWASVVSTHNTS